ncbi:hypothetical protein TNCV_447461 [Trichonephila clavipes]|nr:hypothetical protein TNCV_447461 [Trichonephila clavipes]
MKRVWLAVYWGIIRGRWTFDPGAPLSSKIPVWAPDYGTTRGDGPRQFVARSSDEVDTFVPIQRSFVELGFESATRQWRHEFKIMTTRLWWSGVLSENFSKQDKQMF